MQIIPKWTIRMCWPIHIFSLKNTVRERKMEINTLTTLNNNNGNRQPTLDDGRTTISCLSHLIKVMTQIEVPSFL